MPQLVGRSHATCETPGCISTRQDITLQLSHQTTLQNRLCIGLRGMPPNLAICGTGRSCNHMASQRASCHLVPLHDHPQRMLQAEQAQRRLLQARRSTPISGLSSTHSICTSISASTYFSYLAQACQAMITCCTRSAIKPHLCDAEPKDTQLLATAVCKGIACTARVAA